MIEKTDDQDLSGRAVVGWLLYGINFLPDENMN
jgi:hypothetical protein